MDLSCPCVTAEMACSLFSICLSLFLEQSSNIGRVIALDEAHKYMTESREAKELTKKLLGCIRMQRHIGARVFIATQEPTISPGLLDLCSVTIVHRFSSPEWLATLRRHLAGINSGSLLAKRTENMAKKEGESPPTNFQRFETSGYGNLIGFGRNNLGCKSPSVTTTLLGMTLGDTSKHQSPPYSLLKDCFTKEPQRDNGPCPISLNPNDPYSDIFSKIVSLHVGEALLFAPSAVLNVQQPYISSSNSTISCVSSELSESKKKLNSSKDTLDAREISVIEQTTNIETGGNNEEDPAECAGSHNSRGKFEYPEDNGSLRIENLGHQILKIRIRNRITADGGKSIMAC